MKVRPKEVLLNLPVALLFDSTEEVVAFAANINAILHGKVRLKAEELGALGGRHVGLFYLQRDLESQMIHDEFVRLIEEEEVGSRGLPPINDEDDEGFYEEPQEHKLCAGCNNMILHDKELQHCVCGFDWISGKCEDQ